jgi:hypothetical protein
MVRFWGNSVYISFKISLKIPKGAIRSRKWQNDYMKRALKKLYNIESKKNQRKYQILLKDDVVTFLLKSHGIVINKWFHCFFKIFK